MPTKFIRRTANSYDCAEGYSGDAAGIGVDASNDLVYNADGTKRVVPRILSIAVPIAAASVDANVWVASDTYVLAAAREVHSVIGGASSTLDIKKCTGTTAPASGTTMLSSTFALDSTVNTVVAKTAGAGLSATAANLALVSGDRVAFDFTGTLTGLVGVVVLSFTRAQVG